MIALPLSRTERQWLVSLAITLGLVALFAGIGVVERATGEARVTQRLVRSPWESITRFLAIAHTIVATTFLLTSKRVRNPRTAAQLAAVTTLGIAVCFGFRALGGFADPLAQLLFYAYFVAHELRDESWLTGRNGDAGPAVVSASPSRARWLEWTPAMLVVLVLVGVGAAGVTFGGAARRLVGAFGGIAPELRTAGGAAILALSVVGIVLVLRRAARVEGTTIRGHLARRRPRAFVTAGLLAVLLGGAALTGRLYLMVGLHVVWWAVFAFDGLRRAPAPAVPFRPFTWAWVKTTPRGFVVFHAAVLLAVVGVAAIHAFVGRNDPTWTSAIVVAGRDAFPYWTLMHVSLSWLPR